MMHITPFFGFTFGLSHPRRFGHSTRGAPVDQRNVLPGSRHFPAPWTVEECRGISYIVRDAKNFPVAYVCFESGRRAAANVMTKDEARKIAAGIAKLPELLKRH